MNINLLIDNPNGALRNYINIDPFANEKDGRNKGDISNLNWIADNGEVNHLIADSVLEYFGFPKLSDILVNWIRKLAIGGRITIRGTDFEEVCRALTLELITIQEASILIYGEQSNEWNTKKSGMSIIEISEYLKNAGLTITKQLFENHQYVVEAIRNS